MIVFPNAKINLGLNITAKRPDGYHDLETVFYPIPLEDALEVGPLTDPTGDGSELELHCNGIPIEGDPSDNLIVKAYRLLKEEFRLPPIRVYLQKQIPTGAGMGGGSADATFMLKLLNDQFHLHLTDSRLEELSARLGADCAFFVRNTPVFAGGIGNVFSPVTLSLQGYWLAVVKPDVFVSTREAFSKVTPRKPRRSVREIVGLPVGEWRELLVNDFEESVFSVHPAIGAVKQRLYDLGALYASMSGSGASVYGIFANEVRLDTGFDGCFRKVMKL